MAHYLINNLLNRMDTSQRDTSLSSKLILLLFLLTISIFKIVIYTFLFMNLMLFVFHFKLFSVKLNPLYNNNNK